MEEAANIVNVDGEDELTESEEKAEAAALETFEEKVDRVRDLADEMIVLKKAHLSLEHLRNDVEALQDNINSEPGKSHERALTDVKTEFAKLRKLMDKSQATPDHHLKQELTRFSHLICQLSTTSKPSPPIMHTPSAPVPVRTKTVQLPKIHLPKFDGDVMNWSTFWNQFRVAVDSNPDLTEEHKLAYLRDAVQDSSTKHLLFSGAETEGLYSEVVQLLKERFDQRRTIHTTYCQTLTQLGPVKSIKADLHEFVDMLSPE